MLKSDSSWHLTNIWWKVFREFLGKWISGKLFFFQNGHNDVNAYLQHNKVISNPLCIVSIAVLQLVLNIVWRESFQNFKHPSVPSVTIRDKPILPVRTCGRRRWYGWILNHCCFLHNLTQYIRYTLPTGFANDIIINGGIINMDPRMKIIMMIEVIMLIYGYNIGVGIFWLRS